MISGRFGDILSELYLLSAVLKRWEDEGRQQSDLPLVEWSMEKGFATIERRLDAILANLPSRPTAWLLRFLLIPFGVRRRGPSDRLTQACAQLLLSPSAARERLTVDIFHSQADDGPSRLERAFALTLAASPLHERMHKVGVRDVEEARRRNLINDAEAAQLHAAAEAVTAACAVDDFAPEELTHRETLGEVPSPAMQQPAAAE
jgi:acyl-CoA dehydrogenase